MISNFWDDFKSSHRSGLSQHQETLKVRSLWQTGYQVGFDCVTVGGLQSLFFSQFGRLADF